LRAFVGSRQEEHVAESSTDVIAEIGKALKRARKRQGLSLDNAAKLANLSPQQLREVEKGFPRPNGGRRVGPTLAKVHRIANIYGLNLSLTR
jgi:transcriptional regulator with XRE-family HTH domain